MKIPRQSPAFKEASVDKMLFRDRVVKHAASTKLCQGVYAQSNGINRVTLWRWKRKIKLKSSLLDERHTNSGPKIEIDSNALCWALSYLAIFPKVKISTLSEELKKVCDAACWKHPGYQRLRRAIRRLPKDLVSMLTEGFKETFHTVSATVVRYQQYPGQLCQMDATELDLWVLDVTTGKLFKVWMTTIIDCYSRCVLALMLHRTPPTGVEVLQLLKQAILPKNREDWPFYCRMEEIQRDNGSCFRDKEVKEAILRLKITYDDGPNDAPNSNGKQERFFRTFKEQLLANLVGYTAQASGLAKAKQAAIPWPILEDVVMRFVVCYHTHLHRGIGCTPWERWMEAIESIKGLIFDPQEVIDALKIRKTVRVRRQGIQLSGDRKYSSPALVGLVGREIEVRMDPCDENGKVEAFLDGEYLCELRPWATDGNLPFEISKARLDRLRELKKLRDEMRSFLKTAPPIVSAATQMAPRKSSKAGKGTGRSDGNGSKPTGEIPNLPKED